MKGQNSLPRRGPLAEALSLRPRPARPRTGYQFSDSPEARLGNNLVTSVPTDSSDKTSRPVNAPHYFRNISRTSALYRQNDRRDRGPEYYPVLPNSCAKNKVAWRVKSGSQ